MNHKKKVVFLSVLFTLSTTVCPLSWAGESFALGSMELKGEVIESTCAIVPVYTEEWYNADLRTSVQNRKSTLKTHYEFLFRNCLLQNDDYRYSESYVAEVSINLSPAVDKLKSFRNSIKIYNDAGFSVPLNEPIPLDLLRTKGKMMIIAKGEWTNKKQSDPKQDSLILLTLDYF